MCALPNLDPLWVTAIATAVSGAVTTVLAIITWFYMRAAKTISVEAQRPSFGLEPTFYTLGGGFHQLRLKNSGAVAKELKIDVTDSKGTTYWYAPSLSHDAYILLQTDVDEASNLGKAITVTVRYKDGKGTELETTLDLDFAKMFAEKRKALYQGDPFTDMSESLSNIEQVETSKRMEELARRANEPRQPSKPNI